MIKHVHIADLISLINVAFGFLAIFVLLVDDTWAGQIRIHLAFSLILLALLADGLDGVQQVFRFPEPLVVGAQ